MSILLAGLADRLATAISERLISQSDEVRIMLESASERDAWRERGVHVAVGDVEDEDFVWRAAGGVRTVVVSTERLEGAPGTVLVAGARRAGVDRFIVVTRGMTPTPAAFSSLPSDAGTVILRLPKKKLLGGKERIPARDVAVAVDAADDLAGTPHLDLDLADEAAWVELRLRPPAARR